jgi:hypothetical protein
MYLCRKIYTNNKITEEMPKKNDATQTREEVFQEKAQSYVTCYSDRCPLREHCLRSILTQYAPRDLLVSKVINLHNPSTQTSNCPMYRSDEPVRMPVGLSPMYHDMPGWMERSIKNSLIQKYSRKRYYEYHNGTRPLTPEVEAHVRQTLQDYGWQQEPAFASYVEEIIW